MIEFILTTSLLCTGIFITTWEGMILCNLTVIYDRIMYSMRSKGRELSFRIMCFMRNPLFGCMYCMASVWTFVSWLVAHCPFEYYLLPFYMLQVCGLNALIFAIIRFTVPGYDGN